MVVSRDPVQFFPIWMTVVTAPLLEQTRLRPADFSGERCRLLDFSVWFGSWPLIRRSIFPPLSGSPSLSCFPLAQPICDSFCPDEMWWREWEMGKRAILRGGEGTDTVCNPFKQESPHWSEGQIWRTTWCLSVVFTLRTVFTFLNGWGK